MAAPGPPEISLFFKNYLPSQLFNRLSGAILLPEQARTSLELQLRMRINRQQNGGHKWMRCALLLAIAFATLVLSAPAEAQATPDCRWLAYTKWTGTFSVIGNGTGPFGGFSSSTQQMITGNITFDQPMTPSVCDPQHLQGTWEGTVTESVLVNGELTTPPCSGGGSVTEVLTGTGPAGLMGNGLTIDLSNNTYSLLVDQSVILQIATTDCNGTKSTDTVQGVWGPASIPPPFALQPLALPQGTFTLSGKVELDGIGATGPAHWTIQWELKPSCGCMSVTSYNQLDSTWGPDPYDHTDETISRWGCAMTSLSMALNNAGLTEIDFSSLNPPLNGVEPNNPAWLNYFMMLDDGAKPDYSGKNVQYDNATRHVSKGTLKFTKYGGEVDSNTAPDQANAVLDQALCSKTPHPVIVGVKHCLKNGPACPVPAAPCVPAFPCHFVLVTCKQGDSYNIVDPDGGNQKTLDKYQGGFQTRGSVVNVVDPPGEDFSALNLSTDNNASLLVTDPNGNRTGFDSSSSQILQNIPKSAYFVDALSDDVTAAAPTETGRSVQVFQPAQGTYTVLVNGVTSGPYHLSIQPFSQDTKPQPSLSVSGNAQPGSTDTYSVQFVSVPGSNSTVTAMSGLATYSVTLVAASGGSISPNAPQMVIANSSTAFTIIPENGYQIASVSGCGGTLSGNAYTTASITADCTISASFSPVPAAQYFVIPLSSQGGSLSPNSPLWIAANTAASFNVTPSSAYQIVSVNGCNGTLTGNTYTTAPITANCTITASFAPVNSSTFTVSVQAASGGSISPNASQVVVANTTVSFTVTPSNGYQIASVTGCGGALTGNTYTTGPITANCTVSASFRSIPATTTTSVTSSANPSAFGASVTLTATVKTSGSNSPTGTVTFQENVSVLGTGTLNSSGVATAITSSLGAGSHLIVAVYGGDANNSGSISTALTESVNSPDFSISAGSGAMTVARGHSGTLTLTVTPNTVFNQAVSFACSNLPTGVTCSFMPATVTPQSTAATTTMTVTSSLMAGNRKGGLLPWKTGSVLLGVCLLGLGVRRRPRTAAVLVAALAIGFGMLLAGCQSGSSVPPPQAVPTTSVISVTATASGVQHTINVSLTLQ
jgi:hypothetical protein